MISIWYLAGLCTEIHIQLGGERPNHGCLKPWGCGLCLLAFRRFWFLYTKLTVNLRHRNQHENIYLGVKTIVLTSMAHGWCRAITHVMDQKTWANLRFFINAILMSISTAVDDNKLM